MNFERVNKRKIFTILNLRYSDPFKITGNLRINVYKFIHYYSFKPWESQTNSAFKFQYWVIGHLHLTNLLWFYYLILVEKNFIFQNFGASYFGEAVGSACSGYSSGSDWTTGGMTDWEIGYFLVFVAISYVDVWKLSTFHDRRNCRNLAIAGISQRLHIWRRSIFHQISGCIFDLIAHLLHNKWLYFLILGNTHLTINRDCLEFWLVWVSLCELCH